MMQPSRAVAATRYPFKHGVETPEARKHLLQHTVAVQFEVIAGYGGVRYI